MRPLTVLSSSLSISLKRRPNCPPGPKKYLFIGGVLLIELCVSFEPREQVDHSLSVFTLKTRKRKERERKREQHTFVCTKSQTKYFIAFTINESVKRKNGDEKRRIRCRCPWCTSGLDKRPPTQKIFQLTLFIKEKYCGLWHYAE